MLLNREELAQAVRLTPLVSIDLVIRNPENRVLLGLRSNEPARGCWFVPGGRICKDERLRDAFRRLCLAEIGVAFPYDEARLLGVYEHLYPENFASLPGFGTHYVVLAYELRLDVPLSNLPKDQHADYRWQEASLIGACDDVHPNTRAYFVGR